MMDKSKTIFGLILLVILLSGCTEQLRTVDLSPNSDAASIMPEIENYNKDTEIMATSISPIAGYFTTAITNIATKNPIVGSAAGTYITEFGRCANKKGLSKVTYYSSKTDNLDHAIVYIVEQNLEKALDCILESGFPMSVTGSSYGIYSIKYSFKTTSGQIFHVGALTTTDKIAYKLCENLPGCNKNTDIVPIYLTN